jgi:hypothetical protein
MSSELNQVEVALSKAFADGQAVDISSSSLSIHLIFQIFSRPSSQRTLSQIQTRKKIPHRTLVRFGDRPSLLHCFHRVV